MLNFILKKNPKNIVNINDSMDGFEYDTKDVKHNIHLVFGEIAKELHKNYQFKKIEVSLNFVNSEKIKDLNKIFREKDSSTDVLSFPSGNLEDSLFEVHNILDLGDIFINKDIVVSQAKSIESTPQMEVVFLFLHACLHLIGYDHIEDEFEAERMYKRQREILNKTGIRITKE